MWYLYRVSQTTHLADVAFKWSNVKTVSTETPYFEPKELYVSWFKVREFSRIIAQPEGTYNLLAWNTIIVKRGLWWWDTSIEFIWSPAWISKWYKCVQTVKTEAAFSLILIASPYWFQILFWAGCSANHKRANLNFLFIENHLYLYVSALCCDHAEIFLTFLEQNSILCISVSTLFNIKLWMPLLWLLSLIHHKNFEIKHNSFFVYFILPTWELFILLVFLSYWKIFLF